MRRARERVLFTLGAVALVVFLALALSFSFDPGYGPCPRPPPCNGQSACLTSSCPTYYGWGEIVSLIAGAALIATGVCLLVRDRPAQSGRRPTAAS
ncbi:MAG: hypothetical protein KGI98_08840 [Euryarchaeota archaeon]|nr:hypothetical protein [Euryarchaeota archaeon]